MSNSVQDQNIEEEPKIPRPPNAFMIFGKENRKLLAQKFPNYTNKFISKILGNQWKNIDYQTKAHYHQLANQAYQQHMIKYPNYYYSPLEARQRKAVRKLRGSGRGRKPNWSKINANQPNGIIVKTPSERLADAMKHHQVAHQLMHHHLDQTKQIQCNSVQNIQNVYKIQAQNKIAPQSIKEIDENELPLRNVLNHYGPCHPFGGFVPESVIPANCQLMFSENPSVIVIPLDLSYPFHNNLLFNDLINQSLESHNFNGPNGYPIGYPTNPLSCLTNLPCQQPINTEFNMLLDHMPPMNNPLLNITEVNESAKTGEISDDAVEMVKAEINSQESIDVVSID